MKREFRKNLNDIATEFRQQNVREELEVQQTVRNLMYEEIKGANILMNKRFDELKAKMMGRMLQVERSVTESVNGIVDNFEKLEREVEENKQTMIKKFSELKTQRNPAETR